MCIIHTAVLYIYCKSCFTLALIFSYVDVNLAFAASVSLDVWHKASLIGLYSFASCVKDIDLFLSSGVVAKLARSAISQ